MRARLKVFGRHFLLRHLPVGFCVRGTVEGVPFEATLFRVGLEGHHKQPHNFRGPHGSSILTHTRKYPVDVLSIAFG